MPERSYLTLFGLALQSLSSRELLDQVLVEELFVAVILVIL